jgi:HK97 family phage prohead protease
LSVDAAEQRTTYALAPLSNIEVRDSGAGDGSYTIRGHAAVFGRASLDLGGFTERIAPGAFKNVLDRNPDVLAVWDHDTRYTLASTTNGTLELREDPIGLHTWMRVVPTSYAADLRLLLETKTLTQASFMFTIESETWTVTERADGTEEVVSTINEIGELYDVTVTGRGAYPQTDMSVVTHARAARLDQAIREGRVPGRTLPDIADIPDVTENKDAGEAGSDDAVALERADSAKRLAHRVAVERARLGLKRARQK